jgi:DNA-binding transcriptional regulator YiaG
MSSNVDLFVHNGKGLAPKPYHYKECGLDNVFLANGYELEECDGEMYVSVENVDGLWKAVGLHLVTTRKVFSPKEIRFLRRQMDYTQVELARKLRVDEQTVARWEKAKAKLPGPADLSLRTLYLSSDVAQPEGREILQGWIELVEDLIEQDEPTDTSAIFAPGAHGWESQPLRAAC